MGDNNEADASKPKFLLSAEVRALLRATSGDTASSQVVNEERVGSLERITSELVAKPEKILMMEKFVFNEKLFVARANKPSARPQLHKTLQLMQSSTKTLWKESLARFSALKK